MREQERKETEGGEEEPVEDHRSGAHLGEGDFAEEKSTTPEHAGEAAGGEAEGALAFGVRIQWYPLPPSLFAQNLRSRDFRGGPKCLQIVQNEGPAEAGPSVIP